MYYYVYILQLLFIYLICFFKLATILGGDVFLSRPNPRHTKSRKECLGKQAHQSLISDFQTKFGQYKDMSVKRHILKLVASML